MGLKAANLVVPAQAGTHDLWIPAFAGMTWLSTERSEGSPQFVASRRGQKATTEILRFAQDDRLHEVTGYSFISYSAA